MKPNPRSYKVGGHADPQQTTLRDRFGANDVNGNRSKFRWDCADPLLIAEAIARCVGGGDAVMFGVTRDGGCGVATVLSGEDRKRFYPADDRSANAALMQISWAYSTSEQRKEFPKEFVPLGQGK